MMLIALVLSVWPSPEVRDSVLIARVQAASCRQVDSTLADVPIGRWLHHVLGPRVEVDWSVDDCGEQAASDTSFLCVTAHGILRPGVSVTISILVGSGEMRGLHLGFWWASVDGLGPDLWTSRLGDVPELIARTHRRGDER